MGRDNERSAMELMATSYVIGIGAFVCSFLILVLSDQPTRALTIYGGVFLGVIVLLALIKGYGRGDGQSTFRFWIASRRNPEVPLNYHPKRRKTPNSIPLGGNQPATADELSAEKEISPTTWVPMRGRKESKDDE